MSVDLPASGWSCERLSFFVVAGTSTASAVTRSLSLRLLPNGAGEEEETVTRLVNLNEFRVLGSAGAANWAACLPKSVTISESCRTSG